MRANMYTLGTMGTETSSLPRVEARNIWYSLE
jgi:hypothetical protein